MQTRRRVVTIKGSRDPSLQDGAEISYVRQTTLLSPEARRQKLASFERMSKRKWTVKKVGRGRQPVKTTEVVSALDQDPHATLRIMAGDTSLDPNEPSTYIKSLVNFITNRMSIATMRKATKGIATLVEQALLREYALDTAASIETSSAMSPLLRFGRVTERGMRGVIDWNSRVVIKEYDMEVLAQDVEATAEMAVDIIIGETVANGLVSDFEQVVTPHMAYQIDWFIGPGSGSVREKPLHPAPGNVQVMLDYDKISQYVISERVDVTLGSLIKATNRRDLDVYEGKWNLESCASVLAQVLFTLEAAWQTHGFVHYDFHSDNIMVRVLDNEKESPYTNKTWFYSRSGGVEARHTPASQRQFSLAPAQHQNMFAEIIDFGRSRAFAPVVKNAPDGDSVLIGNTVLDLFGIHVGSENVDPSWDVRRLGWDLLVNLDVDYLALHTPLAPERGFTEEARDALAQQLKHLIVVMSNAVHLVLILADPRKLTPAEMKYPDVAELKAGIEEVKEIAKVIAGDEQFMPVKTFKQFNRTDILMDETMATSLYDVLATSYTGKHLDGIYGHVVFSPETSEAVFGRDLNKSNGKHLTMTAGWLLQNMPLFRPFYQAAKTNASAISQGTGLVVGQVHAENVLLNPRTGERQGEFYDVVEGSPFPATPTRGKKREASPVRGETPPSSKKGRFNACTMCGHLAAGHMIINALPQLETAFCGSLCMEHYTSTPGTGEKSD